MAVVAVINWIVQRTSPGLVDIRRAVVIASRMGVGLTMVASGLMVLLLLL
ncbi:hypothetical protein [Arthrobacter crystallopoietes]|nr:hypothetical protein [Arthrobacter crystallopoietes]QTG79548.1 hypothetical protein J5251_11410 [Arthrobacter crystallopoietes]